MKDTTIDGVARKIKMILDANAAAPATNRRKFPADFQAEVQENYDGLLSLNQAVPLTESERLGASAAFQKAVEDGKEWVRAIHKRIGGLAPNVDKLPIFKAYGFERDVVGLLDDDRVIFLLEQAPIGSAQQTLDAAKLPDDWLETVADLLETLEENGPKAGIGARSTQVKARRETLNRSADLISRVAGYLTWSLPARDFDPLMHDYGFTPRKKPKAREAKQTPST